MMTRRCLDVDYLDMEILQVTPHEHVTVREATAERLLDDVTYLPGAGMPPLHVHPGQAEAFEVRSGALQVRVAGDERVVVAGERFEVPAGTPHTMAPDGDEPVEAVWETAPAGRTLEWFGRLDRETRAGRTGVLDLAPHLAAYEDTFRLAGPRPVIAAAVRVLAAVARLRPQPRDDARVVGRPQA